MRRTSPFIELSVLGTALGALIVVPGCREPAPPVDRSALVSSARAAFDRGDDTSAMRDFASALELADDAQLRALYASSLLRAGRTEEARAQFERALRARPDDALAWCDWGDALRTRFHDVRAAESAFKKALELHGDLPQAHLGLARVLGDLGDHEGACAEIEAALSTAPPDAPWRAQAEDALAYHHMRRAEEQRKAR